MDEKIVINFWGALAAIAVPTVAALAAYFKSSRIAREAAKQKALEEQNKLINQAVEQANRHIGDLKMMLGALMAKFGLAERPKTNRERSTDKKE